MKTLEDIILDAYREGIFPMAESAEDEGFAFYKPHMRGIIPIEELHIPTSLLKTLRRKKFIPTRNYAFEKVIEGCAAATDKRSKTWINRPIRDIFMMLHREGNAHSIECWDEDRKLAGGLYGLALGSVFCGESMFSVKTDASKVALVALCALLWKSGFKILDTQFTNPHLLQFGTYEIPQEEYEERILTEMKKLALFDTGDLQNILDEYLSFRGV
jgi:leucyl/phenylalanyl-tRNA--protein transferase